MRESDKAYAAGIMDGEGTIGIYRHSGSRDKERPVMRVHVGVAQVDVRLPLWLKESFGGWVSIQSKQHGNCRQAHHWQMSGTKLCLPFLKLIEPYLLLKKEQAAIAIAFMESQKIRTGLPLKNRPDEFNKREAFRLAIKKLNQRGVVPAETKRLGAERLCDSPILRETKPEEAVRNGVPLHNGVNKVTGANE